jgi:hypothetical protein
MMLVHPHAVIAMDALVAADHGKHDAAIRLLTSTHPQMMLEVCLRGGAIFCAKDGPLSKELKRWQALSVFAMLLAVKRTQSEQVAGRFSDVLREVTSDFVRLEFEFYEVEDPSL